MIQSGQTSSCWVDPPAGPAHVTYLRPTPERAAQAGRRQSVQTTLHPPRAPAHPPSRAIQPEPALNRLGWVRPACAGSIRPPRSSPPSPARTGMGGSNRLRPLVRSAPRKLSFDPLRGGSDQIFRPTSRVSIKVSTVLNQVQPGRRVKLVELIQPDSPGPNQSKPNRPAFWQPYRLIRIGSSSRLRERCVAAPDSHLIG